MSDPDIFSAEAVQALPFTTPYFLFSKELIATRYQEFKARFPDATIHYAMKANSEPELLTTLRDLGSGFEVASKFELDLLRSLAVAPDKIIYGTSVKPVEHIKEFVAYGVDCFACDSLPELDKIATYAKGSKVYIRISVDDTGSVFRFSEKFGTERGNAAALLLRAREIGLIPYGFSFHVGSQASNPKAWVHALEYVAPLMDELLGAGITLGMISIGGGFPCTYASSEADITLQEIAEHTLEAYKKLPYQPRMILEPGRGIVATTAIAVADVIARIERKEHNWLFIDLGVYSGLFEVMAYQGSTRYRVSSLRHSYDSGQAPFAIAGPTGDSPDVITREALLPADVNIGDKLVFHDVGAYSLAVVSNFNGFPKPDVHFI